MGVAFESLKPGMRGVVIEGMVQGFGPPDQYDRKNGGKGVLWAVRLADAAGVELWVTFFNKAVAVAMPVLVRECVVIVRGCRVETPYRGLTQVVCDETCEVEQVDRAGVFKLLFCPCEIGSLGDRVQQVVDIEGIVLDKGRPETRQGKNAGLRRWRQWRRMCEGHGAG